MNGEILRVSLRNTIKYGERGHFESSNGLILYHSSWSKQGLMRHRAFNRVFKQTGGFFLPGGVQAREMA